MYQPSQSPLTRWWLSSSLRYFVGSPHTKFLVFRKRQLVALASDVRATSEFPALPLYTQRPQQSSFRSLLVVDDVGRSLQVLDRQSPPLQPKPRPRLPTLRQHLSLPPSLSPPPSPLLSPPSHNFFLRVPEPRANFALRGNCGYIAKTRRSRS